METNKKNEKNGEIEDFIIEKVKRVFPDEDIKIKEIHRLGGLTNTNYYVETEDKKLVVRFAGIGANDLVNRKEECLNNKIGCDLGLNAYCYYFDENDGTKIAKYIENAKYITEEDVEDTLNLTLVANALLKLHNAKIVMKNDFDIIGMLSHYENLMEKKKGIYPSDYKTVKSGVLKLYQKIKDKYGFENIGCHNDTLKENFVKEKDEKIYLMDWEYAGNNDPAWDLTSYISESNLSEKAVNEFLNIYYKGDLRESNIEKIKFFTVFQDFIWSVWAFIKVAEGDDFYEYGIERYKRCKRNIERLEKSENTKISEMME